MSAWLSGAGVGVVCRPEEFSFPNWLSGAGVGVVCRPEEFSFPKEKTF